MTIHRELTLTKLTTLSGDDLRWLVQLARAEQVRRRTEYFLAKQRAIVGYGGLVNFMAGVTWALACRASLRASKGHEPVGRGLASGEMWFPWEVIKAAREEVKERGWSPLSQPSAGSVGGKLLVEAQRKDTRLAPETVRFNIRLAQEGCAVYSDVPTSGAW